jgi:hypothetical protein
VKLSELVQEIIEEGTILGPDAIARELVRRRREFNLEAELQLLLRAYVLRKLSQQPATRKVYPVEYEPVEQDLDDLLPISALVQALSEVEPARSPSSKVRGYQAFPWLKRQVFVGSEWKVLGDCDADDVEYLAKRRWGLAQDLLHSAEYFNHLAYQMRAASAHTVSDLDEDVLLAIGRPNNRNES